MDLSNCSEFQEAARLLRGLTASGLARSGRPRPLAPPGPIFPPTITTALPQSVPEYGHHVSTPELSAPSKSKHRTQEHHKISASPNDDSKGGRLEEILETMRLRGGFRGAVVADEGGLPLAEFHCPVETEAVAACSSVLGAAMERAGRLLEQQEANHLTMDINYVDKVVLRSFHADNATYYLLIICPQDTDERSELELSLERIAHMIARRS